MSATETTEVGTVDLLTVLTDDRTLPEGCDTWGIRSVHPDLMSSRGFRWPFPGQVASPQGPILDHRSSCPRAVGDGLCVATTWAGMASGGIPAITLLLVAHAASDVVGDDEPGKLRVGGPVHVVDVIDGARLVRARGADVNLRGANLRDADLRYANLRGARASSFTAWPEGFAGAGRGVLVDGAE